ncbi:unnamed protein product [Withania somnifera]
MHNLKLKSPFLLSLLAVSAIISLTFFTSLSKDRKTAHIHVHKNIQIAHSHCEDTRYRQLCVSTLSLIPDLAQKSISQIISSTINVTVAEVKASAKNCTEIREDLPELEPYEKRALEDCIQLLENTIIELKTSLSDLSPKRSASYDDIQTLLSAAMTNQATCLDGLARSKKNLRKYVQGSLHTIAHHVSNCLAMLKKLKKSSKSQEIFPEYGTVHNGFPKWIKRRDRALLQAPMNQTKIDLIVAKDGTGNFSTINEALSAAPNASRTRFVIYIKEGAYYEYIELVKKKSMIMFLGDGIGKTLIKGNRSVVDGWTTFRSATLAVVGNGFLAKGITFENYLGPSKHQAVAVRNTLYVHSLRQFYRDCDVYGTRDFIFGNATVVLRNCNLYARREDPNQNTGISILSGKIAAVDLIPRQSSFKNYLGRPRKEYSRTELASVTVVINNSAEADRFVGNFIDGKEWLPNLGFPFYLNLTCLLIV